MAIQQSKLRLNGRQNLGEVLPLSSPFSIYVDPSSACNFKCSFCPTGHHDLVTAAYKRSIMSLEMFENIVAQIKNFRFPIKVLRMNKIGEPTLNKNLPEMIKMARRSGRIEWIDFATNGSQFHDENIEKFLYSGVNRINISLEGLNSEAYLKNAGIKINFDEFIQNLRMLSEKKNEIKNSLKIVPEILIKIPRQLLDGDEQESVFKSIFDPIADILFVENLVDIWPDFNVNERSGKKKTEGIGQYQIPVKNRRVCSVIMYSMVINSDGTVSACCSDWAQNLLIGDIRVNTLNEIWHNQVHLKLIKQHLRGQRSSMPICATCGHVNEAQVDDIDAVAKKIDCNFSKKIAKYAGHPE